MSRCKTFLLLTSALLPVMVLTLIMIGCSSGNSSTPTPAPLPQAMILMNGQAQNIGVPQPIMVPAGQPLKLTATVQNLTQVGVTWYVNGIEGGSDAFGTITSDPQGSSGNVSAAIYMAPIPGPTGNLVVSAVANADPSLVGTATVAIGPPCIEVQVTPVGTVTSPFTLPTGGNQTFQATVTSTGGQNCSQGPTNTTVTWSLAEVSGTGPLGTINSTTGSYNAPSSPNTVQVIATSNEDPIVTGNSIVSVTQFGISFTPNSWTILPSGSGAPETVAITATPFGFSQNENVCWKAPTATCTCSMPTECSGACDAGFISVPPPPNNCISQVDSVTYTAPNSWPSNLVSEAISIDASVEGVDYASGTASGTVQPLQFYPPPPQTIELAASSGTIGGLSKIPISVTVVPSGLSPSPVITWQMGCLSYLVTGNGFAGNCLDGVLGGGPGEITNSNGTCLGGNSGIVGPLGSDEPPFGSSCTISSNNNNNTVTYTAPVLAPGGSQFSNGCMPEPGTYQTVPLQITASLPGQPNFTAVICIQVTY